MMYLIAALFGCQPAPTTDEAASDPQGDVVVYAIRHFEKETTPGVTDPELSEVGLARAEQLAQFLESVPLKMAYSTPYQRTLQTVEPVATAKGLEIDTQWQGRQDLAAHILATHGGEQVIAAGHSNTVPDLIAGLGISPAPVIEEDSYGELWVVSISNGEASAERTVFD
jgi:2,3-bisphosphoglycerate-dependent phosphoglycerate mutase